MLLRSEFDSHPLWDVTGTIKEQLRQIREDLADPAELPFIETISFYVNNVESYRSLASTHMTLFTREMLNQVKPAFDTVTGQLANRIATNTVHPYIDQAATSAESSLMQMGPWPRPYGRGGQVAQMETLFENLLERQRESISSLDAEHDRLRDEVASYSDSVESIKQVAIAEIQTLQQRATEIKEAVDGEKARIDEVVGNGVKAVAALREENTSSYKEWQASREKAFEQDFSDLKSSIEKARDEALEALTQLQKSKQQYENLEALAAGDIIATDFARESKWGRRAGLWLYGIGFTFLALAAVPLVFFLFDNPDTPSGTPDWGRLAVRLSIGVLAASGATVLIRLGARLIREANASKRMELELRSFGPFLANVEDVSSVDAARIELLDRAFGKSYAVGADDPKDDAVQVSTLGQIFDAVAKLTK